MQLVMKSHRREPQTADTEGSKVNGELCSCAFLNVGHLYAAKHDFNLFMLLTLTGADLLQNISNCFWIIAENKPYDKQMFMILTRFVHHDNLHK